MFKKQDHHIDTVSFDIYIYIYIYITLGIFIYFE